MRLTTSAEGLPVIEDDNGDIINGITGAELSVSPDRVKAKLEVSIINTDLFIDDCNFTFVLSEYMKKEDLIKLRDSINKSLENK